MYDFVLGQVNKRFHATNFLRNKLEKIHLIKPKSLLYTSSFFNLNGHKCIALRNLFLIKMQ